MEYCSEPKPDPERVCDIPDCIVTNDTEWVLFEGYSDSFHLTCLREIQYCPLCQKLLQHKAKSLAITEKHVVLNPRIRNSQQNKESESDAPEGEVDSNGTLEDSNINIPECETSNVEANIVNIIDAYVLWHLLHPRLKRNGSSNSNSNNNNKPKWPQKL